jgi:hypothetical protein
MKPRREFRPMRKLSLVALLAGLAVAVPATAQPPISGVGRSGGTTWDAARPWVRGGRDEPVPAWRTRREVELAGQIDQLRRGIGDMRETGQISHGEARRMRRETSRLAAAYWRYSGGGLSDSEAAELQGRILAARGLARPPRPPRTRGGH